MSFGSGNRTALRSVQESTWGTTPANPALQIMRKTGDDLNFNANHIVSEEVRSDRMISDLIKVAEDGSGTIDFELSATSYDDWIANVMANAWGTDVDVSATDISFAASDDSINSVSNAFGDVVAGQYLKVSGAATAANNGYHRIVTAASGKLTTASSLVDESAGATVSVVGSMIRNGTALRSATIQKHIEDAQTPHFLNFVGSRFDTMSMNFTATQIVTGQFGIMCKTVESGTSQYTGATTPAATSTEPMSASAHLTNVEIDDAASSAFFRSLSLNIANNLRPQDAIGSLQHAGISLGTLDITGDIELYFQDGTLLSKYINSEYFRISFVVADAAGGGYVISMPKVKFETGTTPNQGKDTDTMLSGSFRAVRDPVTNAMIQFDQF